MRFLGKYKKGSDSRSWFSCASLPSSWPSKVARASGSGASASAPCCKALLLAEGGVFLSSQSRDCNPKMAGKPAPVSDRGGHSDIKEFGRWKVNSLVLERQENNGFSLPLDPEFLQTIRQLGRRPSLGAITDNIIRKYGTHFLLSATLGGEESLMIFVDKRKLSRTSEVSEPNGTAVTLEALHQLAASYFIDRESTLHKLHHIQIASTAIKVTETRTGPLGCSNYDNLDSVSSVLVQSPENKINLQGWPFIIELPQFLMELSQCLFFGKFITAA
ncbi:BMP/retinoic acid-inducible neural-specific protein 3 [Liparis tanakae]|uniref:BMP/retinoic acid-inducible neural-specific protein 3 n=1 Tax=Liparis tanakae TaxID=230148 RepID=A0A4Z2IFI5_9TELE|nr:BMP/retinoic acid-inducible neural-specific protein 3 [Liparis tanakae]